MADLLYQYPLLGYTDEYPDEQVRSPREHESSTSSDTFIATEKHPNVSTRAL
jgi:hypothetical protein